LAAEIAVSGSTALGMADAYSDLELNFWTEAVPPADVRAAWLESMSATDVAVDVESSRDGTLWTTWRQDGVWVEGGWQTFAAHEDTLELLLRAETIDHELLVVASAVLHARPVRTVGRLADWQLALAVYPDALAEVLIDTSVERWHWPHWLDARWAMLDRGERLGSQAMLVDDVKAALRVLFAFNRQWEVGWKWLIPATDMLRARPDGLVRRIDSIFGAADPARSLRLCLELVVEVLMLAAPREAVHRAHVTISEALERHK